MVKISEELVEDLKPFTEIINYSGTYKFDDEDPYRNDEIETVPEWLDFDITNFREFVSWLDEVELFARWNSLTKRVTLLLMCRFLAKKHFSHSLFFEPNLRLDSMLDVKIYLIKKFFTPSLVIFALADLLNGSYKALNVDNLLIEFCNKCRALILAILSFEIPVGLDKFTLIASLLNKIPGKIKRDFLYTVTCPFKCSLNDFFDFVCKKEEELSQLKELKTLEKFEEETVIASKRGSTELSTSLEKKPVIKCYCCGALGHGRVGCPYNQRKCNKCQQIGHLAKVCRSTQ